VLKPKDDSDWSAEGDFKSIALAWDFSPLGEAILDPVTDLARSSGGTVELVHVLRPAIGPEVLDGAIYREWGQGEELREDAERDLAAIANRLGRRGISATARVEIGTTIAGTLVDLINHGPYDLIALTTHGRGGIQRALLGSVADKVIRGSDRPVLVLRPGP
jgi:nucleotide-binding universal stress UspA family protein